jgi:hypothetical protein
MQFVDFQLNKEGDAFVFTNDLVIPFGELSPNNEDWMASWRNLYMKKWCDDVMIMRMAKIIGDFYDDDMFDIIMELGRLSVYKDLSNGYFDPLLGLYINNYQLNYPEK